MRVSQNPLSSIPIPSPLPSVKPHLSHALLLEGVNQRFQQFLFMRLTQREDHQVPGGHDMDMNPYESWRILWISMNYMEVSWKGGTPNHPKLALKPMFLGSPHVKQSSQCCVTGPKPDHLRSCWTRRCCHATEKWTSSSIFRPKEQRTCYIYIYVSENRAYHGISLKKSPNDPKWPFK